MLVVLVNKEPAFKVDGRLFERPSPVINSIQAGKGCFLKGPPQAALFDECLGYSTVNGAKGNEQ